MKMTFFYKKKQKLKKKIQVWMYAKFFYNSITESNNSNDEYNSAHS